MFRTTVKIAGMACGMCEAHINDAVRAAFRVKKVKSSHVRGETVIDSEQPVDTEKLGQVIRAAGYVMQSASGEEIRRPAPAGFFRKK